jgi:cell division septation protein DedD
MADYDDVGERGSVGKRRWGRRILTALIAVAALGGFAMVVVYSFNQGDTDGNDSVAPVVKAQQGPTKVKPQDPGGMKIPNQDKQVFTRLDPNAPKKAVEQLLPPPARVVDAPPEPARAAEIELSPAPILAPPPTPKPSPELAAPPPPAAPKAVSKEKVVAKPSAKAVAAVTAAAKTAPAAGGFRVQLVALGSAKAARTAWARFVKQHADLFDALKPTVVKAEIKGKGTFYRLQAGPLPDDGAARALCKEVKKRKMGCLVVRP